MPRRSRLSAVALLVALLVALPGCVTGKLLTTELWRDYAWPAPVVEEQLLERRSRQIDGDLMPLRPVIENGLWWCDDEDPTPRRWWLCPKPGAGSGAELAAALFADPDFCVVRSAAIDAVRRYVVGECVGNEATLELDVRLLDGAIGQVVPATDVSPAAAQVLATMRGNAYTLSVDPGTHLPPVYRRCVERLADVDLRRLVGEQSAVYAQAWVFVDLEGRPAFRAGADDAPFPPEDDDGVPLAHRLAALRKLSLLVRVECGGEPTILRLRPDRLWLSSGLQFDGDRCVHRSTWHLQAASQSESALPAIDAPHIVSTLRLQEEYYRRSSHPVLIDGALLAKVALTPVTLALDVVLGPGVGDFLRWISGNDRRPSEPLPPSN